MCYKHLMTTEKCAIFNFVNYGNCKCSYILLFFAVQAVSSFQVTRKNISPDGIWTHNLQFFMPARCSNFLANMELQRQTKVC